MCAPCACSAHRVQKRVSDPPELELQAVVTSHVGAGKLREEIGGGDMKFNSPGTERTSPGFESLRYGKFKPVLSS